MTDDLDDVLATAVARGWLTAEPAIPHRLHAERFVEYVADTSGPIVDLGTGGGVPGLVLARALPERPVLLVERATSRAAFLAGAVDRLGLARTVVVPRDAVTAAHAHRAVAGVVTARSFGAPATTAECAIPFLALGGRLVISEPPSDGVGGTSEERWPPEGLDLLGLRRVSFDPGPPAMIMLEKVADPTLELPRAPGRAARHPLF